MEGISTRRTRRKPPQNQGVLQMLFSSPVYSKASGSIAGLTYSHNRGGMYTRARVTPTDPASTRQLIIRGAMATLAPAWLNDLTSVQRAGWKTYGDNVSMTNRLGETVYLTGQQHFLRSNVPRIQFGLTMLTTAPTTYNLGTFTMPSIASAYDDLDINITFDNTDAWAGLSGAQMLLWGGLEQNASRSFYKGPFRSMGAIEGAGTPPTSPATLVSQHQLTEGNVVWVAGRVIQGDGRLSEQFIIGPATIAAAP